MSLSDRLNKLSQEHVVESKPTKSIDYDDNGGVLTTTAVPVREITEDEAAIFAEFNMSPDKWKIVNVRRIVYEQQTKGGGKVELGYLRCNFLPRDPNAVLLNADEFAKHIRSQRRKPKKLVDAPEATLCVVLADPQVGKTGSGGGTDELIARMDRTYDKLVDHIDMLKRAGVRLEQAAWLDAGDIVENFENTSAQAQTNDRDLTAQIETAREIEHHGIDLLARIFDSVLVAGCGSNHGRVRREKKEVGKPSDDFGLHILRTLRWAYDQNPDTYGHVQFFLPTEWQEDTAIDLHGLRVGLTHGHHARKDKFIDWWKGQTHGRRPIADADIVVSGHYHHLRTQQTSDGRWWFQAPNMDAGSDWFAAISGESSPPGMLTFVVTSDGPDWVRVL